MAISGGTITGDNRFQPHCASLQDAATIIKKNLFFDRESLDLSDQLCVTSLYSGVCSGLREDDYPLVEGLNIPLLTDVRRVPLPPELVEQFGHMQCNCLMGIFPEIGRAWLTVDSDIFVWRYADGDDLAYFDGLAETILSVSLVQPKPGIFREHIKYLLVLTTPLDAVLLGVSFAGDDINNEMHLLPDPLFTLSSDNTYLLHTIGTINGRIFTGGKDGSLYEIIYQAKRGWFSRSCVKVNHSKSRLSFLLPSLVNMWLNVEDAIEQLCVDDTRHILYTRSEKGTISVYDLGDEGFSTSFVAQISLDTIQRKARDIASGMEPSNLNQLIHIAPITRHESRHMHLLAVTQAGVRLYFITYHSSMPGTAGQQMSNNASLVKLRPSGIHLVHVRLPPGFTGTSLQRPTAVHAAHYNAGTLLLSATNGDDGIFWCINRDMFAFSKILKETHSNFALDGRAWAISEVASLQTEEVAAVLPFGSTSLIPPDPPIQVIQHIQKPSEYVVITSQGCHMFSKMRPVDQLRYLLDNTPDPECNAVESFFKLYDNGEAACCCIILAMLSVATDRHIAERAVMALVHYGSVPVRSYLPFYNQGVNINSPLRGYSNQMMSPIPMQQQQQQTTQAADTMRSPNGLPVISTPMPGYHPPHPQTSAQYHTPTSSLINHSINTPVNVPHTTTAADPLATPVIYYSERQHGAFKMFSRITRPLWEGRLVQDLIVEEDGKKKAFVVGRIDVDVVSSILDQLNSLKTFVGKHCLTPVQLRDISHQSRDHDTTARSFFLPQHQATNPPQEQYRAQMAEISRAELTAMKYLYELLVRSCEVLGLWRILLHHQIHVLFECMDKQCQTTLKTITFQDLVLSGEATCSSMVSTLINQFMDDNVTVDALNSQLREVCPSLYSADDAIYSKASELLHLARKSSTTLKDENLQRATQLFQQIAGTVNLASAIQQFQAVNCFPEAVELAIKSARAKDPNGFALKLYHSDLSANDPQIDPVIRKCYLDRMECYKFITDILEDLTEISACPPKAPSVPLGPGPPQAAKEPSSLEPKPLTTEEAQAFADNCLQLAIQSDDELLHVTVYEWLLRKNLSSKLLQISSPFIEPFLIRLAESRNDSPSTVHPGVDLLWKHHERSGQHLLAAEVLLTLAEKPGSDRDLNKRIEYLSRAKVNAKSATSALADSAASGALLHDIEEKIEVAQIQMEILEYLNELREDDAVSRLHAGLYDVTTLYSEFAEPYQLAEAKLSIAHCSGLHDLALIKGLWKNIIEDELQKVAGMSETTKTAALKNKLIQLSRRYLSSHRYFPLDYLTIHLEKMACSKGWDSHWVFTSMLEAGVSIHDLIDVYITTHSHKLLCWSTYSKPYHLLFIENEIIRVFVDAPSKYIPSVPTRRRFINRLLDVLASHLVELRSILSPSESVTELIGHMRRNQAVLETMLDQR